MSEERHIDADCGCKYFFTDMGPDYETRVEWCRKHEELAAPLRKILADFETILADVCRREESFRPAEK